MVWRGRCDSEMREEWTVKAKGKVVMFAIEAELFMQFVFRT